jgi:glycosyltransferase involved in cell wall biosynthesis
MHNSFISIIIPTFNRAWCIERALKSVLCQSYENYEIILINDGSTDNTQEVLKRNNYLTHQRINYIVLKENRGVNYARNVGIESASGELLLFFDSDDELVPHALQTIREDFHLIQDPFLGGLMYRMVDHRGRPTGKFPEGIARMTYIDFIQRKKFTGDYVRVYKKEIFNTHNFRFPDISGGFPPVLHLEIVKNYDFIAHDEVLYIYHVESTDRLTGGGQLLQRAPGMVRLYDIFLGKFKKDYERYSPNHLAYFYLEKGIFELVTKQRGGRRSVRQAITYNKNKILIVCAIWLCSLLPYSIFIFLLRTFHRFKKILK